MQRDEQMISTCVLYVTQGQSQQKPVVDKTKVQRLVSHMSEQNKISGQSDQQPKVVCV